MLWYNLQWHAGLRQNSNIWCSPTHSANFDFIFSHSLTLSLSVTIWWCLKTTKHMEHASRTNWKCQTGCPYMCIYVYYMHIYAHRRWKYCRVHAPTESKLHKCSSDTTCIAGLHTPVNCTSFMKSFCGFYTNDYVDFTPGSILKQHWSQKFLRDRLVQAFKKLTIRSCLCGPLPSMAPISGALVGASLLGPQTVWTSWDRDDEFWHVMTVTIHVHFVASGRCSMIQLDSEACSSIGQTRAKSGPRGGFGMWASRVSRNGTRVERFLLVFACVRI